MKTILAFIIILLSAVATYAQSINPNYNDSIAKKLGAEEYGMKHNYIYAAIQNWRPY